MFRVWSRQSNRVVKVLVVLGIATTAFSTLNHEMPLASPSQGYPPPQSSEPPDFPALSPTALPTATAEPTPSIWASLALNYVSEKYGVPVESLLNANEHDRPYPMLGRDFRAVILVDTRVVDPTAERLEYSLLIDKATGAIEEDWNAIKAAEDAAHLQEYGKLEPILQDRLQGISDDTTLPVAIWVANRGEQRSEAELFDELRSRFPEAADALARGTKPMDVEDRALSEEIQDAYRQMVAADVRARVQPLLDTLTAGGYSATAHLGLPALVADLDKRAILELVQRDDVAAIYLIESEYSAAMVEAIGTVRVPQVWQTGITGTNERIAILEDSNIVNSLGCLNIVAMRPGGGPLGDPDHKTRVSHIAACNSDPYRGVAYGAQIIDAGLNSTGYPGPNSQSDGVAALQWAIQAPQNARVVNFSGGWPADPWLHWTDRAFDYWARREFVFIANAAGNEPPYLRSPAKGWNVFAVGATNDLGDAAWANDTMAPFSAYQDPTDGSADREKPEVVAPGVSIFAPGQGGYPLFGSGTSFAAPLVAGLAALLIDSHSSLLTWPEASRAIIMASAVHNIEGIARLSEYDGAGGIDAALAVTASKTRGTSGVPCNQPCWWGISTSSSNPIVGGVVNQYLLANRGERIRAVISWWSNADAPGPCCNNFRDELDTNYNLYVYRPNGGLVGASLSVDNNYDIVDFVAPETGQYRIAIYRSPVDDNNEASNYVGIAWVKDATYLPDLRNADGWYSEFSVRNDGAEPRNVRINYFDTNGNNTPVSGGYDQCFLQPSAICQISVTHLNRIPAGTVGSAIVDGGEDVSVVVMQRRTSGEAWAAYPGVRQAAADLHLPIVQKNNYGWYSDLILRNNGSTSTNMTVEYRPVPGQPGSTCTETHNNVAAQGLRTVNLSVVGCVGASFVGSAYVTNSAGNLITAASTQRLLNNTSMAEYVAATPAMVQYGPLVQNGNYGWTSGLTIQNASGSTNNVSAQIYPQTPAGPGYPTCSITTVSRFPRVASIVSAPFAGCPTVTSAVFSGGALPVSAVVNQLNGTTRFMVYEAVPSPGRGAVGPVWWNTPGSYISGLTVQNTTGATANITIRFYDPGGNQFAAAVNASIVPRGIFVTSSTGVSNGSIVVTSDQPIAVAINLLAGGSDDSMSYAATHR